MYRYVPGVAKVTVVVAVVPAGTVTSVGRDAVDGFGARPVALVDAASPTIHSWSIGSSLRRTIVTGTPAGT